MNIPPKRTYSIMVAISENGLIALQSGRLPFEIKKDKDYYLDVISNKVWIQARKSFENGPSHLLQTKHNFVITRNTSFQTDVVNTSSVESLQTALDQAHAITDEEEEIFLGGGMGVYSEALMFADKIYLTRVHQSYPNGGAFFPCFDWHLWECLKSDRKSNPDGPDFSFEIYQRKS